MQGTPGTCNCGNTCGICACNEWGLTQQGVASKLDWTSTTDNERGLNAFNAIQNQGKVCSAGWAFADAALMEAFDYIANPSRPLQKFSEQQLIDCNPLNYNCTTGKEDELFTSWLIPSKV